jgi:hypothetical protein
MNMAQWWNDIDKGKPKSSEKNMARCHFICKLEEDDYSSVYVVLLSEVFFYKSHVKLDTLQCTDGQNASSI